MVIGRSTRWAEVVTSTTSESCADALIGTHRSPGLVYRQQSLWTEDPSPPVQCGLVFCSQMGVQHIMTTAFLLTSISKLHYRQEAVSSPGSVYSFESWQQSSSVELYGCRSVLPGQMLPQLDQSEDPMFNRLPHKAQDWAAGLSWKRSRRFCNRHPRFLWGDGSHVVPYLEDWEVLTKGLHVVSFRIISS